MLKGTRTNRNNRVEKNFSFKKGAQFLDNQKYLSMLNSLGIQLAIIGELNTEDI